MSTKNKTGLSDLRMHMFDVIERLKSANDPNCDENEKISLEHAKAIAEAGKVIIYASKIEVDALKIIANSDVPVEWFRESNTSILSIPEKTKD